MENQSIDDILGGEPETVAAPVEAAEPTGQVRDEKGRFAPKNETGVEPTAETVTEPIAAEPVPPTDNQQLPRDVYEPLKAVRDENKELKQRIDALQRQFHAQSQPAPQPQQPPADFWDDPQGFMQGFGNQLLQQWEQRESSKRLDASEKAARGKYADYDDAFVAFSESVQANPQLAHQLAQADDPGEFAYRKGKMALDIQRAGSVDDLRAQIRAEIEAEAKAAFQPKPTLPSTTAGDTSIGARSGPEWAGPRPIGDILRS